MTTKSNCIKCNISRVDRRFRAHQNICLECYRKSQKQYREKHAERLKAYRTTPEMRLKKRIRQKVYNQLTPRTYLNTLFGKTGRTSFREKGSKARTIVEIDLDYLMNIWDSQCGRCAITGLQMLHQSHNLKSASIDRIESKLGYIRGNVQLVCRFINLAKQHYSNDDIRNILNEYRELHG